MPRFITHEPIASGWLNMNETTGVGHLAPWARALTNTVESCLLLVKRMKLDYLALSPKMRKPYGKDLETRKANIVYFGGNAHNVLDVHMFHMVQHIPFSKPISPT